MVSATSSSTGLTLESLPEINLSELSQSELHTLSLCSNSTFKHHNSNDLIIPLLNPSIFNKSAGARRQVYSRPYRRRRLSPEPLNSSYFAPAHGPTEAEDKTIVGYLKNLLGDQVGEFLAPERVVGSDIGSIVTYERDERKSKKENEGKINVEVELSNVNSNGVADFQELGDSETVIESNLGAIIAYNSDKRKRKRESEAKINVEVELSNVNLNGVVDFQELCNSDEYYSEELKKRTEGLRSEEEGLGFLRGLNGKWCSKRKKRKFVDASEFGNKFPVGWKILLGLRRRNGCVSVYCRRYVSPDGEHFVSCKEASLYLQSYFRDRHNQKIDQMPATVEQVGNVASGTHTGVVDKESDMHVDTLPILSSNDEGFDFLSMDNLFEVQIHDIYDCSKCKLTFEHKSEYSSHCLEVHQNTTRMYRPGKSVGGGLIIDDEKYKGQKEKSTYEAQVRVDIKKKSKNSKELPVQLTDQENSESPSHNELSSRTCMLDASAEIAHNSMLKNSEDGPIGKPSICSFSNNLNMEIFATNSGREQSLGYHLNETVTGSAASAVSPKSKLCDGGHITTDDYVVRIDGISDIGNVNFVCTSTLDHLKPGEFKKICSSEQGSCGVDQVNSNELIAGAKMQIKEKKSQMGVADSSLLSMQLHCSPSSDPVSYKEEKRLLSANQLLDNALGFEEMRFDEIEHSNDTSINGQQSLSLPEVSMELPSVAGTVEVEQETVVLNNCGDARIKEVEFEIVASNSGWNVGLEDVEQETVILNSRGDAQIKKVEPEIVALNNGGDVEIKDVEQETDVLNNRGDAQIKEVEVELELVALNNGGNIGKVEVEQETVLGNNCGDARIIEVESEIVVLNNGGNVGMEDIEQEMVLLYSGGDTRIKEVEPEILALNNGGEVAMEDFEPETVVLNNREDAQIKDVEPEIFALNNDGNKRTVEGEQETISLNNCGNARIKEVEPEIVALNIGGNVGTEVVEPDFASNNSVVCLITSVCVWCAKKFTRETVESEDQSESVGFMCPTCKATISRHLDNGFHDF